MGQGCCKNKTASSFRRTVADSEFQNIIRDLISHTSAINTSDLYNNSSEHCQSRIVENFTVVWLDPEINQFDANTKKCVGQLRRIVNSVQIFVNPWDCFIYVLNLKDVQTFLIVGRSLGQEQIEIFSVITELIPIYRFCDENIDRKRWIEDSRKVKGVFIQIEFLCNALKNDVHQFENDLISINILTSTSFTEMDEVQSGFINSLLIKMSINEKKKSNITSKKILVEFSRTNYNDNNEQLQRINEFEEKYPHPSPIWWYTRYCFISHLINKAFRTRDFEIIIKMNFFLRDLHRYIEQKHSESVHQHPFIVYRGQGILHSQFEEIKKSKDCLISFNNFLLTNIDRNVSLLTARRAQENDHLIGILFTMEIDPLISSVPFVSLDRPNEILFSFNTIFRIDEIKQIDNKLFQVNLILISDHDQQLKFLNEHIQTMITDVPILDHMGMTMVYIGELDNAEQIFTSLVEIKSHKTRVELALAHIALGMINSKKGHLVKALSHYHQSIDIFMACLSPDDYKLYIPYSMIGEILRQQGHSEDALTYLKRALNLSVQSPEPKPEIIVKFLIDIGSVFRDQGNLDEACKSFTRALKLQLIYLPSDHLSLCSTQNNIGVMYLWMNNYSDALLYFEKTLQIHKTFISSDHLSITSIHSNMAMALDGLCRTNEAIEHSEQAVNIALRLPGSTHSDIQMYQKQLRELQAKRLN